MRVFCFWGLLFDIVVVQNESGTRNRDDFDQFGGLQLKKCHCHIFGQGGTKQSSIVLIEIILDLLLPI